MILQEHTIHHRPCLVPAGDLVTGQVEELQEALERLVQANHGEILIDCTNVNNVYSRGLALLMKTHKRMRDRGQPGLVLVNLHPRLVQLLNLINLPKIVPCFATEEEFILQADLYRPESGAEDGSPAFHFTTEESGGVLVVHSEGMLSAICNLTAFKGSVSGAFDRGLNTVLDMRQVYILDSTGIGALVELYKAGLKRQRKLVLMGAEAFVRESLEELDLEKVLLLATDWDSAMKIIAGK